MEMKDHGGKQHFGIQISFGFATFSNVDIILGSWLDDEGAAEPLVTKSFSVHKTRTPQDNSEHPPLPERQMGIYSELLGRQKSSETLNIGKGLGTCQNNYFVTLFVELNTSPRIALQYCIVEHLICTLPFKSLGSSRQFCVFHENSLLFIKWIENW